MMEYKLTNVLNYLEILFFFFLRKYRAEKQERCLYFLSGQRVEDREQFFKLRE